MEPGPRNAELAGQAGVAVFLRGSGLGWVGVREFRVLRFRVQFFSGFGGGLVVLPCSGLWLKKSVRRANE